MDIDKPVPTTAEHPAAPEPAIDYRLRLIDRLLFVLTLLGAVVVYAGLFTQSLWGFVIGEVVCGSAWVGAYIYKRMRTHHKSQPHNT